MAWRALIGTQRTIMIAARQYRLPRRVPLTAWVGLSVFCTLLAVPFSLSQQNTRVPHPPNPYAPGVVVVQLDGPATVNVPDFKIEYTIINNTPDVVDGTLTAVFNGSALTTPGGPTNALGPE